jgi:hypothetical protein
MFIDAPIAEHALVALPIETTLPTLCDPVGDEPNAR